MMYMDFLFRCSKCSYEFEVTSNDMSEYILHHPNFLRCPSCGQPAPKLITVTSDHTMPKDETPVQKLWSELDRLKVELKSNPHPKASRIVKRMEKLMSNLRRKEIHESS